MKASRSTNYRWVICAMLFFATTINYLDRQVLSLTWKDFIAPEFHWTDADYGNIASVFALVYAIANVFSGRFVDWLGTRKGYLWAIGIWSFGACAHAFCGVATEWTLNLHGTEGLLKASGGIASAVAATSAYFFIVARIILGVGESGNFPAAVKVAAEYFPKKDRAFATSIFNAGSTVGALAAPVSIPLLARYFKQIGWGNGWEMAFIIIGALGFVWMGIWMYVYQHPENCKHVNKEELAYINQDDVTEGAVKEDHKAKISFARILTYPQTWAIFFAKFITDGVWWFFLFWTPAYISDVYGMPSHHPTAMALIFVLYAITMLSIYGGKLPTIIVNRTGLHPYEARLRAMLVFAIFPLFAILAQPLGTYTHWFPVILIGIAGAAHQSWSANLFSVCSDLFPKSLIGTITGINGMAGGISSAAINKISGHLFDYADATQMTFLGFQGKPAGYFIIFCYCGVAYIIGWCVLKLLVPKYKLVQPK